MANITVPFKILYKGYEFSGDIRSGYHATVPYFVAWDDAFTFIDEVMFSATATVVGPFTVNLPLKFPTGAPLYANAFRIQPCGSDGSVAGPNDGLRPGEFYTHAIITVQFDTPNLSWSAADDPTGLQQLDPANPITICEQAVKINANYETRPGSNYRYDSDSKAVNKEFAVLVPQTSLTLTFPKIPYMPWSLIKPYIGTINNSAVLNCAAETLLLLGMNTTAKMSTGFGQNGIAQQLILEFAQQDHSWNKIEKPDGSLDYVHKAFSADKIYAKTEFVQIFNSLSSSEA
jgi:hypothetical protein